MATDMRKQARTSVAIESIPDDAIEAAQDAFHEFAMGPGKPLTKRDKGITRLAYRAAIHAALEAMSEPEWEYQCRLPGNGWTDVTSGHRCSGERRRRCVAGPWESIETGGSDD